MGNLEYLAPLSATTPYNEVLLHPQGRAILEKHGALPRDEHERYELTWLPVGSAIRTAPALQGRPQQQAELLRELGEVIPSHPIRFRVVDTPAAEREQPQAAEVQLSAPAAGEVGRPLEVIASGVFPGNPYTEIDLDAEVVGPASTFVLPGFFDGTNFRLRFLPLIPGEYRVITRSAVAGLDRREIVIAVAPAERPAPGPVRIEGFHFRHADGSAHRPVGTTAYGWLHQSPEVREQTVTTLGQHGFTKMRMCLFPKWFAYNERTDPRAPFTRSSEGDYSFDHPDFQFWDDLDDHVRSLDELGIQADIILFHPYDMWGFSDMGPAADDRYVRYAVARLSAFPNIWWSLANEYDILLTKDRADWERLGELVQELDHVGHPRSIHHCLETYDHGSAWITHASMQDADPTRVSTWRREWGKPVILDEYGYEGDLPFPWGDLTAEEALRRHWQAAVRGGYGTHGETYWSEDDIIWWSAGGALTGESPTRLAFLADLMKESPAWEPLDGVSVHPTAGLAGEYSITYLDRSQARQMLFVLDPDVLWSIDVIDTWAMTIDRVAAGVTGRVRVPLPRRPYLAVRMLREPPIALD